MPLTFEQKKKLLEDAGLNPAEYTVDEFGPSETPEETPTITKPPVMSPSESFFTRLKRSTIPGLASLPGVGVGANVGRWAGTPFGPIGMGIGTVGGGIVGGIGANLLTSKAQEKVLETVQSPEDYKAGLEKQAQAERDNKIASFLGDFAPQALGLKPSLSGVRGLGNLIQGTRLDNAARSGLINSGISAGVSGGVDLAQQAIGNRDTGEGIDWTRVGLNTLAGGLLSEPNRIGRRFFPATPEGPKPPEIDRSPVVDAGDIKTKPAEIIDDYLADTNLARPAEPVPGDKKLETDPNYEYPIKGDKDSIPEEASEKFIKSAERKSLQKQLEKEVTGDDLEVTPDMEYNEDPGAVYYQPALSDPKLLNMVRQTIDQDKWSSEQLNPNSPFGYKISRFANTPAGNSIMSPEQMIGTLKNKFPQEWGLFEPLGLGEYLGSQAGKKVTGKTVDNWIRENAPKVEVKNLEAIKTPSKDVDEYSGLLHWLDSQDPDLKADFRDFKRNEHKLTDNSPDYFEILKSQKGEDAANKMRRLMELHELTKEEIKNSVSESATARYTMVNPKPLKDMPGAVDLLVRIPLEKVKSSKDPDWYKSPKYSSYHYPNEGKNLLAHVRGYMETLPDGKKAFHVFEVQSDWAQDARKAKSFENRPGSMPEHARNKTQDDPLLKHYERLALKAAIDHARKNGADYIALSDAETAMLTEQHDRYAQDQTTRTATRPDGSVYYLKEIPQEQGMRLHYDQTLPKYLEELTGERGQPVEFGEHQNAHEGYTAGVTGHPREDLIFKNPDGTLKTKSTARLYPLAKAKEIIESKGGIALTGNKLYQPATDKGTLNPDQLEKGKAYATKRGVQLEQKSVITNPEGEPQRGYSIPSKRVAAVSDIATPDTPYHEVGGHQFPEDLRGSLSPKDRELIRRVESIGDAETRAEFIGKRIIEAESQPVRTWLQDAWANAKRVAGVASDEDALRHLARRAKDDRPYNESPELWTTIPEGGAIPAKLYSSDSGDSGEITETPKTTHFGAPLVDRLGASNAKAGEATKNFELALRQNQGKYVNKADGITKGFKQLDKVRQWIWETRVQGSSAVKLLPEDLSKLNSGSEMRRHLVKTHEDQRAKGILVSGREAKDNPNYFPLLTDLKVINTLKRGGPEAARLKQDYIDFQLKYNPKEAPDAKAAEQLFNDYFRGISAPSSPGTPEYQAVRKAQGLGIPLSWLERDPRKLFRRYFNNVARDFAYFDAVQSKPEIAALFNVPDQFGNPPKTEGVTPVGDADALKLAKNRMTGEHTQTEVLFNSIEHMVRGFILGTATGIRNHVSAYVQMLPYVEARDIPKILEAFKYLTRGFQDSLEAGVNRWHITDLESANLGFGYYADKLKALGDLARKYQGATAIEQWTRAHNMMVGELVAQAMWGRAAKGEIKAKAWLRKFGADPATPMTREALVETAAQFVERVQGTYGMRGLPAGLLEPTSPAYWLLSLSKWGVEKANVVKEDVIGPAMRGEDFGPLIRYATAGALGGAAIIEINKLLSGKKAATPDMKELQEAGTADDYAYKAFEIASLAGLGGILSDAAKGSMDLYFKNAPKAPGIPSINFLAEDVVGGFSDVMEAVNDGAPAVPTLISWLRDTVVNNIQGLKLVVNQTKGEENERKDKFRDLRVYNQLHDKPVRKQGTDYNPYLKKDEKEFKQARSIEDATNIYTTKIKPSLDSKTPEDRKRSIEGLKRNSYQTMPSDRREQREYLEFLSKTQGATAGFDRLEDKRAQDLLNRRKARLIPRQ